jgi:hypothetical protein
MKKVPLLSPMMCNVERLSKKKKRKKEVKSSENKTHLISMDSRKQTRKECRSKNICYKCNKIKKFPQEFS